MIDLPFTLYYKLRNWFVIWVAVPLVNHYRWYSKFFMWVSNGPIPSCQFTAITMFAEAIGQPAHIVHAENFKEGRVNMLAAWESRIRRPLLISVIWSEKNRFKCHWFFYEKGYVFHSAAFGSNITWNGKSCGFLFGKKKVGCRWTFDRVATQPELPLTYGDLRTMGVILYRIMAAIPGMEHTFKLEKMEKKFRVQTVSRTYYPGESVSLDIDSSKNEWS